MKNIKLQNKTDYVLNFNFDFKYNNSNSSTKVGYSVYKLNKTKYTFPGFIGFFHTYIKNEKECYIFLKQLCKLGVKELIVDIKSSYYYDNSIPYKSIKPFVINEKSYKSTNNSNMTILELKLTNRIKNEKNK